MSTAQQINPLMLMLLMGDGNGNGINNWLMMYLLFPDVFKGINAIGGTVASGAGLLGNIAGFLNNPFGAIGGLIGNIFPNVGNTPTVTPNAPVVVAVGNPPVKPNPVVPTPVVAPKDPPSTVYVPPAAGIVNNPVITPGAGWNPGW